MTAWRKLLELALKVLDEAGQDSPWTLGGGTALSIKINHRMSYDIDLFLESSSLLHALSPNRNKVARAITKRWQEPGNYLKLEHPDGEIDFILAVRQTNLVPWLYHFKGREIRVEEPGEVIAKKLKYRSSRFLPRDIFDLLAVHRFDPTHIKAAVLAVPDGARRAADRIQRIAKRYRATIQEEVNPTSTGVDLVEVDPLEAANLLL